MTPIPLPSKIPMDEYPFHPRSRPESKTASNAKA